MKKSHRTKFDRWRRLGGKPLLELSELVVERLVPPILDAGFEWVSAQAVDPDYPVSAREIVLERLVANRIESISFNFDKYRSPKFQIHLSSRDSEPPHRWIHDGSLVKRASQYYSFWGKPWWFPRKLWSADRSRRVVARIETCMPQAFALLEAGTRGPNISRKP